MGRLLLSRDRPGLLLVYSVVREERSKGTRCAHLRPLLL